MPRIILIDDDFLIRDMLSEFLEEFGYEVITAADGAAGLKLQRQQPADLIITDLIMPGQEGIETIIQLNKEFPSTKIIAISGGGKIGPDSYLKIASLLGATTMEKPLNIYALREVIADIIANNKGKAKKG